MNAPLIQSSGFPACVVFVVALLVSTASAQMGDPQKEAFLVQEQEYIRQLQDILRMPDFAERVIEDLIRRYPDAAVALKILKMRGLLSQGKFDEVNGIIANHPDPNGAEAWAMRLAVGDGLYAFGRNDEAFERYDDFFKKYPQPTPEIESFYLEAAYKYPQMLLASRMERRALDAYRRLLKVKLPEDAMRQVQADTAELNVKLAIMEPNAKAKEAFLTEADKLSSQLLWDPDMWFGKAIVTKAHILVLRGNISKAQALIDDYMGTLQLIHDSLVAQEQEEGITGLTRLSPMAECRFLLAVMLADEAMKIAADPAGDSEQVKNLLLGERVAGAGRKPNGAYQHFINVFGKFPDSQWAMEAGDHEQRIRAFIQERFNVEIKPMFTPDDYDRIRQKQFQEARQKFAGNQFAESIPIFLEVLNHFPESAESVTALGSLTRACLETPEEDGYHALLAETIVAHISERFCKSPHALSAGNELMSLAENYGALNLPSKREQTYALFFRNFADHPDAPQRLLSFGAKAAEAGDDAGALVYFQRLIETYPASVWYGDTLSRIAALYSRRQDYTNELATLDSYLAHVIKSEKPGLAVAEARARIAQANRAIALARVRAAQDDAERSAGSVQLLRAAVGYDQVLKDIDAIPATVATDAEQADRLRQQAILQKAACLAQIVAPPEAVAKIRPQAITTYLAFVKDFPQSEYAPLALIKAGTMYTVLAETEKAQEVFAQLRRDYPDSDEARSSVPLLAASLMEMGLRGEAIAKYKEMFSGPGAEQFPDHQLFRAARALVDAREYDTALQGFERVIASPKEPAMQMQARFGRAQAWVGMKKFAEARAELDAFVDAYRESTLVVDAYLLLADAASAEGEKEKNNDQRMKLFNRTVEALKFVRKYRKETKEMLAIDLLVGQTMIRKMNAEQALGLADQAAITRGRAIVAFKQLIFSVPTGNALLDPLIEQAYLLSIPLELEHRKYQGAADACEEYLKAFGGSRNAPQVRTWLNQAAIELRIPRNDSDIKE